MNTTKDELTIRLKRASEAYENAKAKEIEAIRMLADAKLDRERAKEKYEAHFMALEQYRAKTETAVVGY